MLLGFFFKLLAKAASSQLPEPGNYSKKPNNSNHSPTQSGNLNLIHECENAVATKVPDSEQLENKPISEPAAGSKQELQSTHTQGQVSVEDKRSTPEEKPLNTPEQELQRSENLRPENTSQDSTISPETDCCTDSTLKNDAQNKKTSTGGNCNVLKTNSEHIKESDGTADAMDQNMADQGVSTEEEHTKPIGTQHVDEEDNSRQEHEDESNQQKETGSSADLEHEKERNPINTEEKQQVAAETVSDEKNDKEKHENDNEHDDEGLIVDDNEDDISNTCSKEDRHKVDEGAMAQRPRSDKIKPNRKKKKLQSESRDTFNGKGDSKRTSETEQTKHKNAQQLTKVEDGANGTKVFGNAVQVQTNVDSGETEPLERSSSFETIDVEKESTQTPALKEKKNQVLCLFHI